MKRISRWVTRLKKDHGATSGDEKSSRPSTMANSPKCASSDDEAGVIGSPRSKNTASAKILERLDEIEASMKSLETRVKTSEEALHANQTTAWEMRLAVFVCIVLVILQFLCEQGMEKHVKGQVL